MKSYNNLWEELVSFKNIYNAYKKARKSNPNKKYILQFTINLEKELFLIQEQLTTGNFNFSTYRNFKVYEPKERIISAPCFRDVVVQHAIINIIEPIFDKLFINNSFACRKNKGTHKGLAEIKKIIQSKKHPKYYLKQDVKKYFPSIHKPTLKLIISKRIKDKQLLLLIFKIIDSYFYDAENKEKGIPIGNLTSQLFANIYLNELDQFIKHTLKVKHYFRYVDDFLIFSDSKQDLKIFKRKTRLFLKNKLLLTIPNYKTNINLIEQGVDFLGYKVFPNKIILRKSNVKRFIKRTNRNIILLNKNRLSLINFESSLCSFLGYSIHANSRKLILGLFLNYSQYNYLVDKFYY